MYICCLKQIGLFVISLKLLLVIPIEKHSIGRKAHWEIRITNALSGRMSTVLLSRCADIFVSLSGWLLSGRASAFHAEGNIWTIEIFAYWFWNICGAFSLLTHFVFLIQSRHFCCIHYWSISFPLHVTSYVHWEKVNPGKTCYQLYLGATEVWSAMKVNTLLCIFCPQKKLHSSLTERRKKKPSLLCGSLAQKHCRRCLPQYSLLVCNSCLKTETQTQVFNYRHVEHNITSA